MEGKMPTIEDIILQKDGRNISALRPHLPADFATEAAQLILDYPGKALIVSGFYIIYAGAPETDGPPGAAGIGEALAEIGYDVAYVTDRYSMDAMESVAGGRRVIDFPIGDHRESTEAARDILAGENPSVLISIERAGLMSEDLNNRIYERD